MSAETNSKHKYYKAKRKFGVAGNALENDLKGFLCSCNNNEKECVREAYNILNKYADQVDDVHPETSYGNEGESTLLVDESDFSKELMILKEKRNRFKSMHTGARNIIFINTTLNNPVELAERILEDMSISKIQQTRFLLRLVPIEVTCRAQVKNIVKAFEPLAEKYFKDKARTFSVICNFRMNSALSQTKEDVINAIANMVSSKREDHKVNLKEAEVSIIVEAIKGTALLSVIPNYLKYKKFNLHAVLAEKDVEVGNISGPALHDVDKTES